MPDRRTQLADAALALVAGKGLKGLTHRAVDAAASVSEGTTSNYFRSRAALVAAAVDRVEELDVQLWQSMSAEGMPASVSELADRIAGAILALTQEHADLSRARLVFALDKPEAVEAGHTRFLTALEQILLALAVPDAPALARAVADYGDGAVLHALTARRTRPLDRGEAGTAIRRLLGA